MGPPLRPSLAVCMCNRSLVAEPAGLLPWVPSGLHFKAHSGVRGGSTRAHRDAAPVLRSRPRLCVLYHEGCRCRSCHRVWTGRLVGAQCLTNLDQSCCQQYHTWQADKSDQNLWVHGWELTFLSPGLRRIELLAPMPLRADAQVSMQSQGSWHRKGSGPT